MRIFIDDFRRLRIESDQYIYQISIKDNQVNWLKNEGFNQFFVTEKDISLHQDDFITVNEQTYPLEIGVVCLTKAFDERFRYDGKLGYDYTQDETTFRLFSPVAKEVYVVIEDERYPMQYDMPIWTATIHQDLHLKPYHYDIRLVDTFKKVKDPYTVACSTKDSYVIDWNQLNPIDQSPIKLKNYVDAVIYEGHVRDMSIGLDVPSKGLFEGLVEHSHILKGSVLNYIKKLGMTHLQLLPVYDFEGVDDLDKDVLYNWGYNPSQYFAIEGWYDLNPDDPMHRINSFRRVINEAHRLGLGINMDVVYNHVWNHQTFPYDDIVPGYFFRHNKHHHMTESSYCGNDVETRNYMVRKLIVDSLIHFVENFQIDGFRFDLMGLIDVHTMQTIEKELRLKHPSIMLYGEGWHMPTEIPNRERASMHNQDLLTTIGHFNDFYRNTMKGELHGPGMGYSNGNKHFTQKAMDAIIGSPHMFKSPNQSINYVECHDNMTYHDKMLLITGYEQTEYKVFQDFANHLIAISQGVPFYHAGQEFYRSKKGVENSYKSPDDINQIFWQPNLDSIKKLKKLLKLRKKFKLYRQTEYSDQVHIEKDGHLIIYTLENDKEILRHYIKNYEGIEKLSLHEGKLIFPSQDALEEAHDIYVDKPGIYIVHIKK